MILGYGQLVQALDDLFTVGSLRVLDCKHKLPLTRQWFEGQRSFDPVEVERLKVETIAKRIRRQRAEPVAYAQ